MIVRKHRSNFRAGLLIFADDVLRSASSVVFDAGVVGGAVEAGKLFGGRIGIL